MTSLDNNTAAIATAETTVSQSDCEHTSLINKTSDVADIDITAAADTSQLPQPILPLLKQATYRDSNPANTVFRIG